MNIQEISKSNREEEIQRIKNRRDKKQRKVEN